jgi:GWxTD domain-containing protein
MRAGWILIPLALAGSAALAAVPLPELFQRVKLRVAAGDFAGGLEALKELEAEASRPENEGARGALRPAAAFYRGVCFASLGKDAEARAEFGVYQSANPNKMIDRNAYPKKVVALFEEARKSGRSPAPEETSSLAVAYRDTPFSRIPSMPPGPEWASGPVKFLLTPEEGRTFARIGDDSERAEFVARFWLGSDPAPGGESELRREFERRVAFADERLSEESIRGSLTDRGMVFLLLGPPSAVIRRPITAAEDTPAMLTMNSATNPPPRASAVLSPTDQPSNWREVWRYNRDRLPADVPYQQVDFAFVTRIDYGKNLLQREPAVVRTLEAARVKSRPRTP